jgi:hypothetical protein
MQHACVMIEPGPRFTQTRDATLRMRTSITTALTRPVVDTRGVPERRRQVLEHLLGGGGDGGCVVAVGEGLFGVG